MSDICPEPLRLKYFSWRYTATNVGWAVGPLIGIAAGAASTALFIIAGVVYAIFALALHVLHVPIHQSDNTLVPVPAPLLKSLKTAIRDPRLAFFVGGGTLLIAVYGRWSATLAPYLTGNITAGMEIFCRSDRGPKSASTEPCICERGWNRARPCRSTQCKFSRRSSTKLSGRSKRLSISRISSMALIEAHPM